MRFGPLSYVSKMAIFEDLLYFDLDGCERELVVFFTEIVVKVEKSEHLFTILGEIIAIVYISFIIFPPWKDNVPGFGDYSVTGVSNKMALWVQLLLCLHHMFPSTYTHVSLHKPSSSWNWVMINHITIHSTFPLLQAPSRVRNCFKLNPDPDARSSHQSNGYNCFAFPAFFLHWSGPQRFVVPSILKNPSF